MQNAGYALPFPGPVEKLYVVIYTRIRDFSDGGSARHGCGTESDRGPPDIGMQCFPSSLHRNEARRVVRSWFMGLISIYSSAPSIDFLSGNNSEHGAYLK